MRAGAVGAHAAVEQQLRSLQKVDDDTLRIEYRRLHQREPPADITRNLLETAVGFQLQSALIAKLRHRMRQGLSAAEVIVSALATSADQAFLIREYRGQCHLVTLLDDGVLYQGEMYPSLSDVATAIVGNQAQGDVFFGLRPVVAADGGGDRA